MLEVASRTFPEESNSVESDRVAVPSTSGINRRATVIAVALGLTVALISWCFSAVPLSNAFIVLALSPSILECLLEVLTAGLAVILPKSRHANAREIEPEDFHMAAKPPLVVPVIFRNEADIDEAICCVLDIRRSPSRNEIAGIALLVDFADCSLQAGVSDAQFQARLEQKLALQNDQQADGLLAIALYRERSWNPYETRWMGWERKRGKIIEFMRLTRGQPTSFTSQCPPAWLGTRYLMSIDVDTRPEQGAVARLIAALESNDTISIAAPTLETLPSGQERLERWLIEPNFSRPLCHEPTARQLVYGSEMFCGKGAIAVDSFLNLTGDIPENCVLSHDHLEALLSGACAVGNSCVSEPFPATRQAWERRQHRWFRGDTQILAWGICGRSWYTSTARRLSWPARVAALRLALNPINCAIRYLAILALSCISAKYMIATLCGIVALNGGGLAVGTLSFVRSTTNGYRNNGIVNNAIFYIGNSVLRAVGELVFLQRLAILGGHATALALVRMCRPSRRGLLEWYPENPRSVVTMRSCTEAIMMLLGMAVAVVTGSWQIFVAIAGWSAIAALISALPAIPYGSSGCSTKPGRLDN